MSTPAPTNVFYLIDDYNTAAGTGMGSGQPLSPDFVATSVANATQVGYLFATIMQQGVRLVNKFNNMTTSGFQSTAIGPGPANTALTVVPSGTFAIGG
jgi:hypothetical protein